MKTTNNSLCPECGKDFVNGFMDGISYNFTKYFPGKIECPFCKNIFMLIDTVEKEIKNEDNRRRVI